MNPHPVRTHAARWSWLALGVCTLFLAACFVDPSDPQTTDDDDDVNPNALKIELQPNGAVIRPGTSQMFTAEVTGDGADQAVVELAFSANATNVFTLDDQFPDFPKAFRLIGTVNLSGNFQVRASATVGTERSDDTSTVDVAPVTFGNPASIVRIPGGELDDAAGAAAFSDNKTFVAFANYDQEQPDPLSGDLQGPFTFIERRNSESGEVEVTVTNAFEDPFGVGPNLAADAAGNAYWLDNQSLGFEGSTTFTVNQLPVQATTETEVQSFPLTEFDQGLFWFTSVDGFAIDPVASSGRVYFAGRNNGFAEASQGEGGEFPIGYFLWRLEFLTQTLELVDLSALDDRFPNGIGNGSIRELAVDHNGRLLMYIEGNNGPPAPDLVRLEIGEDAVATIDSSWTPDMVVFVDQVRVLAVDAQGLVYAVTQSIRDAGDLAGNRCTIHVLNEFGFLFDSIGNYGWCCPSCGDPPICEPTDDCARMPEFQNVQGLGARADGLLQVADRVYESTQGTQACPDLDLYEPVRFVLVEPVLGQ